MVGKDKYIELSETEIKQIKILTFTIKTSDIQTDYNWHDIETFNKI